MLGREKQATLSAWTAENLAREKRLRPLKHYMPEREKTPDQSAAELRGMVSRMAARQEGMP